MELLGIDGPLTTIFISQISPHDQDHHVGGEGARGREGERARVGADGSFVRGVEEVRGRRYEWRGGDGSREPGCEGPTVKMVGGGEGEGVEGGGGCEGPRGREGVECEWSRVSPLTP